MLEKTLERPLDCKEIQPVHPKGNQSWIFIGRTDAEAEAPVLCPPNAKNWLIGKDPDAGKDWREEEKRMTENEMVGWHHWLDEHEFEQAPGVGDGLVSLVCCSPWGHKESDTTERLTWTELDWDPQGFSDHEVSQARILEHDAISYSRGSSPLIEHSSLGSPAVAGRFFTTAPPLIARCACSLPGQGSDTPQAMSQGPPKKIPCLTKLSFKNEKKN